MQHVPRTGSYLFTCATCGEQVDVDGGVRELLLLEGCVVCDSEVAALQFERVD